MSDDRCDRRTDIGSLCLALLCLGGLGHDRKDRIDGDILALLLILGLCGFGGLGRHCSS